MIRPVRLPLRISLRIPLAITGLCLLLPRPAFAQDADAEEPPERWEVAAELSFTDQSGNESLRLLTTGLNLTHLEQDRFELDVNLQSRYGEDEEKVIARHHYGSVGFDFAPRGAWSPFLFADAEHDRFKRLDLRASGGAGAKYTFYDPPNNDSRASLSLALLYSYENQSAPTGEPEPDPSQLARLSLRLKGEQELRDGVKLTHLSFVQPATNEFADYLLRTETGIKTSLSERLALSVVYQTNRDNRPPDGVQPDDRVLKTGLIINF